MVAKGAARFFFVVVLFVYTLLISFYCASCIHFVLPSKHSTYFSIQPTHACVRPRIFNLQVEEHREEEEPWAEEESSRRAFEMVYIRRFSSLT